MNAIELLDIISSGETSKVQFKQEMDDDKFAAEMIAMSNSKGGVILVGIEDKTGKIIGLSYRQLQSYNNRLATVASDKVKPQIFIETEVITIYTDEGEKKVLVVTVSEGISKPYKDRNGAIWIKQGSDKRKLTDNNEQIRLFQQSGSIYVDEMIVPNTFIEDVDPSKVEKYIKALQKSDAGKIEINETLLTNLNIIKDKRLTLGGLSRNVTQQPDC